jgi:hypothetical protein
MNSKNFCKICALQFVSKSIFYKHESIVHQKYDKFVDKKLLVVSLTRHEDGKFVCSICKLIFATDATFTKHMKLKQCNINRLHEKENKSKCNICEKSFHQLKQHVDSAHE